MEEDTRPNQDSQSELSLNLMTLNTRKPRTATSRRSSSTNPPYAPWSQVKDFLNKMKVLNPRYISLDYLRTNNLGGQQPNSLLLSIKFLGLIDAQGAPTDKLESIKVRGDHQYSEALETIVREAYSELFSAVNVEDASSDVLYNQMRVVFNCSPRIANAATPLFINLCQEAGIVLSEVSQPQSQVERKSTRAQTQRTVKGNQNRQHDPQSPSASNEQERPVAHLADYVPVTLTFNVIVNPNMSEGDIFEQLLRIDNARRRFETERGAK